MKEHKKPKVSAFIAMTLDGYISRENGDIDWLMEANKLVPEGEDGGYKAFMSSIDTIIMGRNTFEQVLTFGEWPYKDKKMFVMSSRDLQVPVELNHSVAHTTDSPQKLVKRLIENGSEGVYVDGGKTIQSFLSANLIDEITVTIIPILLGSGKPLFGFLEKDILLELVESRQIPGGFVQLKYKVLL